MRALIERWQSGEVELAPITQALGIKPVSWSEGRAQLEMQVTSKWHNAMGTLHGGVFCDLADVAFGAALATIVTDEERFSTVNLSINYLAPVTEGRLLAEAIVIRKGREMVYLECTLQLEDRLVAKASSTYQLRRKK